MGLVAAARLSAVLGQCDSTIEQRIEAVLLKQRLPFRIPADLTADAIVQAMSSDKKKTAGKLRFILLRDVGEAFVSGEVAETAVRETVGSLQV
jgi:3-dehydroquinate synthetase